MACLCSWDQNFNFSWYLVIQSILEVKLIISIFSPFKWEFNLTHLPKSWVVLDKSLLEENKKAFLKYGIDPAKKYVDAPRLGGLTRKNKKNKKHKKIKHKKNKTQKK